MSLHNPWVKGECVMYTRPLLTAQVLHWNTQCIVKCVISDLLRIWWTSTVVGAASLVEVSKVCNNYLLHTKVCNKWFNVQSSAFWLATGHMISNNYNYKCKYQNMLFYHTFCVCYPHKVEELKPQNQSQCLKYVLKVSSRKVWTKQYLTSKLWI